MPPPLIETIVLAGDLHEGDICDPRVEFVSMHSTPRVSGPCRVEHVGKTAIHLKEIFGTDFWVDPRQPCHLLQLSK